VEPRGHERVLNGIGGAVIAPQDQPRRSVQAIDRVRR
jgi:hypothetical protein